MLHTDLMLVLFIGMAAGGSDQHRIFTEHGRFDRDVADQCAQLPDGIRNEQVPGPGNITTYDNHIRMMFPDKIVEEPTKVGGKYLQGCFCMYIGFSFIRYCLIKVKKSKSLSRPGELSGRMRKQQG